MDQTKHFASFYDRAAADQRIGATHVSLYMALLRLWAQGEGSNPFLVSRQEVMPVARIQGRATYLKCMKELEQYGFIEYSPSFNPVLRCEVKLLDLANAE
jgi:hypothetical protein